MKRPIRFLMSLVSLGAIAAPAFGQSAGSTTAFARGCEQMMHKNFSTAISSFTEAINDDPNDVNSYFRRGQSFFCVGNYKEAIVDFDRALTKGAMDFNVYLWKGTAYAKLDNMEQSVFNYEKAMRLNPKLVETYRSAKKSTDLHELDAAQKSTAAQQPDETKTEVRQPSQNDGTSVLESRIEAVRAAAVNLTTSKISAQTADRESRPKTSGSTLSLGSSQKPIEAYEVAAKKIVDNEIGYFRAGTTYSGLLNSSGSVITLSGFSGQPEWVETAQGGRQYFALKNPDRDLRELDGQIILHPQDATLYFQRARVSLQIGKSKEALSDLNRAIELDGANANYFLARAFYYHKLHNDTAAESEIRLAQDIDPIVPSELTLEMPEDKEQKQHKEDKGHNEDRLRKDHNVYEAF